jgi:superfamily I DNA/RNA helicase
VPDDKELADVLNAPLAFWRVFLHPKQRNLAAMNANGPVRVLGGAGTGKTVVAMHRAKHLVSNVFTGKTDRILFTTFTRNLATDIFENLRTICTVDELSRIDVINLDQWVSNFLRSQNYSNEVVFGADGNQAWQAALNQKDSTLGLSDEFYRSEWEQVAQLQDIRDADAYIRAPRLGRGTRISREKRMKIWPVFQEYRALLNEQGKKEFIDLLRDARCLIEVKKMPPKYKAVIVDEAQDMSSEAFRLIRLLAAPGPNDLFITGDAHQRIYRYKVSLGQCGIDIRGRGKKLKLNYRTTEEIRSFAVRLLEGKPIDDLDSGMDNQAGFLSLAHGEQPVVRRFPTFSEELTFICDHIQNLAGSGAPVESICVIARTNQVVELYQDHIENSGTKTYQIKRNVAEQIDKPGLRLATMHRVKGLEFEHVIIVSANDGLVPLKAAVEESEDEVARGNAEISERSLLYVALTRAKKTAVVTGYGTLSPFLA